jgi:hypothetical protein
MPQARTSRSIGWVRARLRPAADRYGYRRTTGALGLAGSLALHLLLIEAALLGEGTSAVRPPREPGLAANAVVSGEETQATLILIEASGFGSDAEPEESRSSRGTLLQTVRLTVISPEPVPQPAFDIDDPMLDEDAPATESSIDQIGPAKQFGLYLGQIQARIERAWLRPRSPLEGDSFSCRVEVLQSRHGDVREVTLQQCDGDVSWQLSLVHAIERASPLPAPPDAAVFTDLIRLSFRSRPYVPGQSEDGFEPVGIAPAVADLMNVATEHASPILGAGDDP